ncbi:MULTISPECIES: hypothetical protein [Bacillus]|uniref:hypothetical protein n=1 Tax=Bacillus TaxID=1386 RepID=UPI00077AAB64|nr:hypothetical protein [Bacillus cereus]KXY15207.1 hypothetical protein AT273_29040 [Bacillus cereus]MCO4220255.1 hypothetical protein [Bacillus sp. 10017]MCO4220558.1 hypothetical protein [Bacillus sp. 10017]
MDSSYIDAQINQVVGQVNQLADTVERVTNEVVILKDEIATIKRSEVIKKINDSEPVEMNCKVSVNLDGKSIAETTIEHTADSIQVTPNGVYIREDNRKKQF